MPQLRLIQSTKSYFWVVMGRVTITLQRPSELGTKCLSLISILTSSSYGTPAWNCYWAELNGNSSVTWQDAHLDSAGIEQAQTAHDFWRHEIDVQKIPTPQSYYSSPLTRAMQTANITFFGLKLPIYFPFIPTIKELMQRRHIDPHLRSSAKQVVYSRPLPSWTIEAGFTEYDELWNGV